MGWKRFEYTREACPCGNGHFVVECNESDNGYSGDMWSHRLECDTCTSNGFRTREITTDRRRWHVWRVDGDQLIERIYE